MTRSAYASGPFQSPVTESQLQLAWVKIKGLYWLMKLRKLDIGSGTRPSGLHLLSQAGSFFVMAKVATGNLHPTYPFGPQSNRKRFSFPALICQSHRRALTGPGLHHISEVKRNVVLWLTVPKGAHGSGTVLVGIRIPQEKAKCTLHLSWVYTISKQVNCGLVIHTPNNWSFYFYICITLHLATNSQHLNKTWWERGIRLQKFTYKNISHGFL